ncbi:unnamed protein product [Mytilus coruscus]|uniref:Retrotransposon gag domain-containing protein n=1 Tax=Mytilus coruscus TaxID=42192 RepID=A0A6J8E779_MYTCO|nr:unnamed protein product [Mytilus coruscus]
MAEQEGQQFGVAFQNLSHQLQGLSIKLGAQGVNQIIPTFSGDQAEFKNWMKSIEKYAMLTNLEQNDTKLVAYQSSTSSVSDFIHRWLRPWLQLKEELSLRFAEVTDSQHAFEILNKLKQKPTENVQVFAERLLTLAEEAFRGQDGTQAIIQSQLINFFINGLSQDTLKMKIMRENPDTLQRAVTIAMTEQNLRKKV